MTRLRNRGLLAAAFVAAILIDLGAPRSRLAQAEAVAGQPPVIASLPEFSLVDSGGQKFDMAALKGKCWVFDFVFTRCSGPCPLMSTRMGELQKAFAGTERLRLATITVDPAHDTPDHLAEYAKEVGARKDRWLFLTGGQDEIFHLSNNGFKLGAAENKEGTPGVDTQTMPLLHSTRLVLVDAQARIRGYYDATDGEAVRRLKADARAVAAEATP